MSAVCILTPVVIGSWPMIATAVTSVAASMGFTIVSGMSANETAAEQGQRNRVESEIPNSEVLEESMGGGEQIRIEKDGLFIEIGRDERGACTVCVDGAGYTKDQLRQIGQEVSGRVVQQFAYHKLMTELKNRNYDLVEEEVLGDESIQVRVRLNG